MKIAISIASFAARLNNIARLSLLCVLAACAGAPDDSSNVVTFFGSGGDEDGVDSNIDEWRIVTDGDEHLEVLGWDDTGLQLRLDLTVQGDNLEVRVNDIGAVVTSPEWEIIVNTLPESDAAVMDDLYQLVIDLGESFERGDYSSAGVGTVRAALSAGDCFLDSLPPKIAALFPSTCGGLRQTIKIMVAIIVVAAVGMTLLLPGTGAIAVAAKGLFGIGVAADMVAMVAAIKYTFAYCPTKPDDALISWCELAPRK